MWNYLWPVLIVVCANTFYNISTKSIPGEVNPFAALSLTYIVAAVSSVVIFLVTSDQKNLLTEVSKTNWASIVLGFSIIGLEVGYIFLYRAGWKISTASLVANIGVAVVLLIVGLLLYKESLSIRQFCGIAACAAGLVLICK